jgi:predicted SAM-dependent methyltransferase
MKSRESFPWSVLYNFMKKKVQFGCGLCAPAGWLNFDCSPTLKIERMPVIRHVVRHKLFPLSVCYGDIVRGLPLTEGGVDLVYCSHVLEHLAFNDVKVALRNTLRILKPGGVFRMVLPDLEFYIHQYQMDPLEDRANNFLRRSLLGVEQRPEGILSKLKNMYGNSKHLWMWDFEAMRIQLEKAGFTAVRRAVYRDSKISDFIEVEEEGRWTDCLGIECVRPENS